MMDVPQISFGDLPDDLRGRAQSSDGSEDSMVKLTPTARNESFQRAIKVANESCFNFIRKMQHVHKSAHIPQFSLQFLEFQIFLCCI